MEEVRFTIIWCTDWQTEWRPVFLSRVLLALSHTHVFVLSGSLQEKIVHLCSSEKIVNLKFSEPKLINLRIFIQVGFYFCTEFFMWK